jgi:hypothetical protein
MRRPGTGVVPMTRIAGSGDVDGGDVGGSDVDSEGDSDAESD